MSYKDLLYIHRSYAGAALRAEGDPLAHAFAPSVLAVYRSSCQIVTGVKDLMGKHQELLAECWFFWSLIFSSCVRPSSGGTEQRLTKRG